MPKTGRRPPSSAPTDAARLRLDRLERLQWLTEALSAAVTREEVARIVFDRGLSLVDASAVSLFWERRPGELELLHGLGLSEEYVARYRRIFSDEPLPAAEAYREQQPVWFGSRAAIVARFPKLEPLVEREGLEAWAAAPLASGTSRGAVGLQYATPRAFDTEERAFVLAVVRQCALAIERARLFDAQRRLADRLQQLHLTSATLSAATTPREVAAAAFRALAVIGASGAEIHATEGPERLSLLARHGRGEDVETGTIGIDAPEPAAEVVRTGRALWLESPDEIAGRFPNLEAEHQRAGEGAWAVVPLLASGKALGALTVAFPAARRLEADDRTFVRLVAQPCAAAIERARLFEEATRSRSEAEWSASLLGATFSAAPVGLALLDRALRFVRVNEVFARIGGLAPGAHEGLSPGEAAEGVIGEQLREAAAAALDGAQPLERVVVGETRLAPGATRRFGVSAFPVEVDGRVVGVGLVAREAR